MRAIWIVGCVAFVSFLATTSQGQTSDTPTSTSSDSVSEPITGAASVPLQGSEEVDRKDPFQPYSIGPADSAWPASSLNAAEQQVLDHGRLENFTEINNGYAAAAKVLSDRAKAEAAATQLGVDHLDTTGVP